MNLRMDHSGLLNVYVNVNMCFDENPSCLNFDSASGDGEKLPFKR